MNKLSFGRKRIDVLKVDVQLHVHKTRYPLLLAYANRMYDVSKNPPHFITMRTMVPKLFKENGYARDNQTCTMQMLTGQLAQRC